MSKQNILTNRISPDWVVGETTYVAGLLDVVEFLFVELEDLLKKEDRYFGIVKSYTSSIREAYSRINSKVEEEDIDIFGRILFLYKPLIIKEFRRLKGRRLSPADACITIIHKLLEIISEYEIGGEVKTVSKVIGKLWDNIRNTAKNDSLYYFSDLIKSTMKKGEVGKYPSSQLVLRAEEQEKTALENPGERISEDSGTKVMEINLI